VFFLHPIFMMKTGQVCQPFVVNQSFTGMLPSRISMNTRARVNVCMCVYVRTYVCIYVCVYVCMYVCMYVCICVYVCMYVYMYVCMYVYV
jgi:hypothetical protein